MKLLSLQVKLCEPLRVLTVQPRMVFRRADEQVGWAVVRAIAVDVMHMFTAFQQSTESLFGDLHMYWLRACRAVRLLNAFGSVDIAAHSNPFVCSPLSDITARLAARKVRNFDRAAIRAGVHRLAVFVTGQSDPFGLLIPTGPSGLESRFTSSLGQPLIGARAQFGRTLPAVLRYRRFQFSATWTRVVFPRHTGMLCQVGECA